MEKEYKDYEMDWNALEGDFHGFLEEKNWEAANVIIDNLAELKEFQKGLELCMKRCAAIMKDRMTLPSEYGEEKKTFMPALVKDRENGGEMEVMLEGVW